MGRYLLISLVLLLQLITTSLYGNEVSVREMDFVWKSRDIYKDEQLEVAIEYEDPTDVSIRLNETKGSRILTFNFSVRNISERTIQFKKEDITLDVGVRLKPASVKDVMEEIKRNSKPPSLLDKILGPIPLPDTRRPIRDRRQPLLSAIEKRIKEKEFPDGEIKPGKKKEGLILFIHPSPDELEEIRWAVLELPDYLPEVIKTKGVDVYTKPKDHKSFFDRFTAAAKRYITGETPVFGKSYALLVGVQKYQNIKPLLWPSKDVTKMRDFLIEQGFEHIASITDKDVKLPELQRPWEYFKDRKIGKEDRFVFYFSGHGNAWEKGGKTTGYILLANAKDKKDEKNSVPMDQLVQWMNKLDAKHMLIILDCCFSGQAIRGTQTKDPDYDPTMNDKVLRKLANQPSRYLFLAGIENQESLEGNRWNGGLFTDAFIRGLKGEADIYDDKIISAHELYVWLLPVVTNEALKYEKDLYPLLWPFGEPDASIGDFLFIRN